MLFVIRNFRFCCLIVCFFGFKTTYGLEGVSISPSLAQATWISNYVGTLYIINYSPPSLPLNYQLSITPSGGSATTASFTTSNCTSSDVMVEGFSASCSTPGQVVLSAAQPLATQHTLNFSATEQQTSQYSLSFSTTLDLIDTCAVDARNYSSPFIQSASPCTYQCVVSYRCSPGYVSGVGSTYNAICSASGTLDPPEICIYIGSSNQLTMKGAFLWSHVIIAIVSKFLVL